MPDLCEFLKVLFPFPCLCSLPLTADLLDNKEMLDTSTDNAAGFPSAGGLGETLEGADDTKEHPSEKINLVGKAPWVASHLDHFIGRLSGLQ